MSNRLSQVPSLLLQGMSVVVVGPSDSGKTYWVEHVLIPAFQDQKEIVYFRNGNVIEDTPGDVYIFDEAETLCDREFLENRHPEDRPYYSAEYFERVHEWHAAYRHFTRPSVYVITRNDPAEIEYLTRHLTVADWDGRPLTVVQFSRTRV